MELGMQHWGLKPIIICSNDDPRMARSSLEMLKNVLLQSRWVSFHNTWNVAFGTSAHYGLFK